MALNAAIVISWIAYHNYQPKVLQLFHFEALSYFLVVAQALILVFIPVVAGWIGDAMIKRNGNSLVVFTIGVSVTAMIFMCVAFIVGSSNTIDLTRALPVMIVLWLISMNIFHSPANSMLELFAPAKRIPAAMAMMVLTTDLLYALEPVVVNIVDWMGPVVTFAFGGFLLIVTGYYFRKTTRHVNFSREAEETSKIKSTILPVVAAGLTLGVVDVLIKEFLPEWLLSKSATFPIHSSGLIVSIVLVVAALAAWPLSFQVDKLGVRKAIIIGVSGALISLGLVFILPFAYVSLVFALLAGVFLSLASVSAFPFALQNLSVKNVTLGTGVFFGCVELTSGILSIWQQG